MFTGYDAGIQGRAGGRKALGDLFDPLRMGSERRGRLQQVFCTELGMRVGNGI